MSKWYAAYSRDERRIADWYMGHCGGEVSAGEDPVGLLIAGYEHLQLEVQNLHRSFADLASGNAANAMLALNNQILVLHAEKQEAEARLHREATVLRNDLDRVITTSLGYSRQLAASNAQLAEAGARMHSALVQVRDSLQALVRPEIAGVLLLSETDRLPDVLDKILNDQPTTVWSRKEA